MNQNKEVTPLPRAGATTEIPGPYLSPEQTESFPLKSKPNSGKTGIMRRCCCGPFCSGLQTGGAQNTGGLRPVVACFFTFSLALTIALVLQIRLGEPQILPHGSVASDSRECSQVGASILRKGGNAVDAAIATTVCLGVVLPHLTGIGGGGFIAIYDHRRRMVIDAIDFRETAPQKIAPELDFVSAFGGKIGGHTVGVPGFLKGLGLAHKLHGRLSWAELITPSINLCRTGFLVPSNLIMARSQLLSSTSTIQLKQTNPLFWEHFESLEAGHNMIDLQMANTLQAVANEGPEAFYNGSLTDDLIEAVITSGGQLGRIDLESYKPVRRPLIRVPFGPSSWVYSMGAPSGGPLLLASLNLYNEAYAAQARGSYQTSIEQITTNSTADLLLQNENVTNILKKFSVKFTPTEFPEMKSTKVYVTPLPSQETTLVKNDNRDALNASFKSGDTTSKFKDVGSKGVHGFKSQLQNSYHSLNGSDTSSVEEIGKAIIEPYRLRWKREESSGKGGSTSDQAEGRHPEDDVSNLELLLKSLKDASFLHSQLGDPDFSKHPNEGYQIAVEPSVQLKMIKNKVPLDGDLSEFYKPQLHRPAGSNVAIVDADELYVSVVSGLNTWFGSQVLTSGGYLLNNALANFFSNEEHNSSSSKTSLPHSEPDIETLSLPPPVFPSVRTASSSFSQNKVKKSDGTEQHKRVIREVEEAVNMFSDNQLASGKRPLSESVVAFIVPRRGNEGFEGESYANDGPESGVEPCGQRIILGSADAVSAAQVLVQIIFKGLSLVEGIEATRVKPIVSPRNYGIEVGPESSKWGEESVPTSALPRGTPLPLPYPSVNGVQEIGDNLASHSDSRGGGVAARF